jgi:hypothetical protein
MSDEFNRLPFDQQLNVLRILVNAEDSAKSLGNTFEMSLDEVIDTVLDFGGSLDDPLYVLPLGLMGKW